MPETRVAKGSVAAVRCNIYKSGNVPLRLATLELEP